jgi:cytosine/adenosine deaminase-related metal-dependent hydrolase
MVEVMRTGLFMERVRRQDGRRPTPEEALRWATRNGYRAMGIAEGGWLAPGNLADLIVIRTDRSHLVPRLRIVSGFVHQGQAADVEVGNGGRALDHARRPGADHGRAGDRARGRSHRAPRLGAAVRGAAGACGAARLRAPAGRLRGCCETTSPWAWLV